MHLIGFHRVLIVTAILFFVGYGVWELAAFVQGAGVARLLFAAGSILVSVLFLLYLRRLRRFLGIKD